MEHGDIKVLTAELKAAVEEVVTQTALRLTQAFDAALKTFVDKALAGQSAITIMELRPTLDYDNVAAADSARKLHPGDLRGLAAKIYELLQPFAPTLEFWTESKLDARYQDSSTSGFRIVAHWAPTSLLLARINMVSDPSVAKKLETAVLQLEADVNAKAQVILRKLIEQVKKTADVNLQLVVMELQEGTDFHRPRNTQKGSTEFDAEWLGPVARTVLAACSDYAPAIEYWSRQERDMRGEPSIRSGFNLVIRPL